MPTSRTIEVKRENRVKMKQIDIASCITSGIIRNTMEIFTTRVRVMKVEKCPRNIRFLFFFFRIKIDANFEIFLGKQISLERSSKEKDEKDR